ncbi:MAG: hypothetical protein WBD57_12360, partial [Candidatus Cybelea sp.]
MAGVPEINSAVAMATESAIKKDRREVIVQSPLIGPTGLRGLHVPPYPARPAPQPAQARRAARVGEQVGAYDCTETAPPGLLGENPPKISAVQ